MCFFLPDNGENQTKEGLHRKFNAFICVIFIFRRRLFPFLSFDFLRKFVATGGPYLRELPWSKKKKKKVLTKICRIFILFHISACKIKLRIPVICCNPPFNNVPSGLSLASCLNASSRLFKAVHHQHQLLLFSIYDYV